MKDSKTIRKILFLGKSNIALVVMNRVESSNNILFADQVSIDPANLKVKISELLTNAANFLGFNIKDVEIVFDDSMITKYSFYNEEFVDCVNEDQIAKEIYKKAKIDNYFVNEINFLGVTYDEIDKVAKVNCEICASDYITYKQYMKAVTDCNVVVTNSTNLYRLLKGNKEQIELTITFHDNQAIACEYYGHKLNNVKVIDIKFDEIVQHIADKFNVSVSKVNQVLAITNDLAKANEYDVDVVNNYDLKTKTYNTVKAKDVLALYRDEVRTQINNYVDFRNFQSKMIISDYAINAIDDFIFARASQLGFDNVSLDKIVCLNNIDLSKNEMTQFNFENKIKAFNALA